MREQTVDARAAEAPAAASSVAVQMRGVTKRFVGIVAVDGVDLEVESGEFFSMLGPSGSGKTTMLRMIAGFEQPSAGTVWLDGVDVTELPPFDRDVNTVFQDYALFPHMTVEQNIEYGLKVRKVPRAERRDRVVDALATVRLEGYGARRPNQLSGGQRQRVALARALVNHPRVLLLDEPLGALDLKLRGEMQIELKQIQRQVGITFIFVTHDQEEALTMSDRIAVFKGGRIEQIGRPSELYERPVSEFVAGFVGTSNVLTGDHARRLLGTYGTYTVRPERIRLVAPVTGAPRAGPDDVVAEGTVRGVQYLGSHTRCFVELDAGVELVVDEQNRSDSAMDPQSLVGSRVTLAWSRDQIHEIEDQTPGEAT